MKTALTLIATTAALTLGATAASAQDMPGQPGADTSPRNAATSARDTSEMDIMRDRDSDNIRATRSKKAKGPVAATADQVTIGMNVYDMEGEELGTIASTTGAGAVVASSVGRVQIPMEAFGIDGDRLLIAMSKKDFDAAVAAIAAGG